MVTNLYAVFTKLLLVLALPSPILPLLMTLSAVTALCSLRKPPFFQTMLSIVRNEALSIGLYLAVLQITLLASRFILSKIQGYLESLLHFISPIKIWTCFTLYIIAAVAQLSTQRFHSWKRKVRVPSNQ